MATAAALHLAATRPTAGSTAARYLAARSAASRITAPRPASSRSTALRSAACRFTVHTAGGTPLGSSRLAPLRCAADAPSPPADAPTSAPNTPPPPPLPSKWLKLWNELKPMGFSFAMLLIALGVGMMASKENPKEACTYLVTLCEKSEKIHKILSHFLPVVVAIVKSFW